MDMFGKEPTDGVSRMVSRRKALKTAGALTTVGFGASSTTLASPDDQKVVRLKGSYRSPLSLDETREKRRDLIENHPRTNKGILESRAEPMFSEDVEIVEYIARVTADGRLSQYYGGATKTNESAAHDRGRKKEQEFEEENEIGIQATSTDYGGDWNFIKDDQASVDHDYGSVINNFEWYRIREDDEEHNGFRSRSATAPSDGFSTDRWHVEHDWGRSDLGNRDIHSADPSSSGSSIDVSIGEAVNPLEWSFSNDNSISQNLDNSGPTITWDQGGNFSGLGGDTHWLHPGSHVVSDPANCDEDQDVVYLTTEATWIGAGGAPGDTEDHTWRIYTTTC